MKAAMWKFSGCLLMAFLLSCGGERNAIGDFPAGGEITITPDPVVVAQGSRHVVRVDVTGAGGEAPTAYEFDLDERLSGINVTTAPCPAAVGRPACQDWAIEPSLAAIPGNYVVSLRTVGLSTGVAQGQFELKVIAATARYGGAQEISSQRGTTIVIAEGRLYAGGNNEDAGIGAGYLQSDFNRNPGGFVRAVPHPTTTDAFVPVRAEDPRTRFVSIATSGWNSFAVDDAGRVLHWGSRRANSAGDGVAPGDAIYQLQPTRVETIPSSTVAVSTWGGNHHAIDSNGTVLEWGTAAPVPRYLRTYGDVPVSTVSAVVGGYAPPIVLMGDGTVREQGIDPKPGLPGGMVAIAYGDLKTDSYAPAAQRRADIGEVAFAIGADGSVWWWTTQSSEFRTPRRETAVTDATAITVGDNGYVFALRSGDAGLWGWRPAVDTVARPVAPPAGTRFVKLGGNFAITNDCGPRSGSLWRVETSSGELRVQAVHEFGVGGNCGAERTDTSSLSVSVNGGGWVVSDPAGIACGPELTCEHVFRRFSKVRLFMLPQPGWRFARANCGPERGLTTVENLTVIEPGLTRSCTFTFAPEPPREVRLTLRKTGSGEVTSTPQGIVCGASCSHWFGLESRVTLSAFPTRGFRFDGFSGDAGCDGASVLMNVPKICEARFVELPPPSAPADLRVSIASRTSIGLAWNAGTGLVDLYRLERSIAGGPFVLIRSVEFSERTFLDTNLSPNVAYTYRLTAIGPNGISPPASLTVTTPPVDPPPPPPPPPPSSQWRQFGAALPGSAAPPALALNSLHQPIVATIERDAGNVGRVRVRRWADTAWADLGTPNSSATMDAATPALIVDAMDRPIVAWTQIVPDGEHLLAARFNGTSWDRLCGEPVTCALNFGLSMPARRPSLALDAAGLPLAAWIEFGAPSIKRFDGVSWQTLPAGRGPAAAGVVTRVRVAVGGGGAAHVAWISDSAIDFVGVARADASAWTPLGTTLSGSEPVGDLTVRDLGLGVGASGVPTVAWVQGGVPGTRVYARQWDGAAWTALGNFAASTSAPYDGFAFRLSAEGIPYVALSSFSLAGVGRLEVTRLFGANWETVSTFDARLSDLALAMPQTGATTSPHLVWSRAGAAEVWRWTP